MSAGATTWTRLSPSTVHDQASWHTVRKRAQQGPKASNLDLKHTGFSSRYLCLPTTSPSAPAPDHSALLSTSHPLATHHHLRLLRPSPPSIMIFSSPFPGFFLKARSVSTSSSASSSSTSSASSSDAHLSSEPHAQAHDEAPTPDHKSIE